MSDPKTEHDAVRPLNAGLSVSFEFFPPYSEAMERNLWSAVDRLLPLGPRFVSVTYGAGGSTRERTHATVRRLADDPRARPAAHLTCVDASRAEVDEVVDDYYGAGIRHIVALRGDPSNGASHFEPHPQGYASGAELVAGIRRRYADRAGAGDGIELSVGAYPEVHPDATSPQADLDNLKRKIDAGASRAITQFFFDADVYLRFLDRCRDAGITVPIVPGILPVHDFKKVHSFAQRCGANVPDWLAKRFEGLEDSPDITRLVAATVAAEQCTRLQEQGVREFHFYTLNRAELSYTICHILGMRPQLAVGSGPAAVSDDSADRIASR
ncbi:MAG: methylenetetrahydrofolate reductase [NAD(P)H] [Gammaproteobacteria bacterium]|nr:methylenetetrahydrofolate reductase [NAD(P)H] [Gammaproteobacteria bacterium]